ncbi:MAG: hypothetical protein NC311_04240 [Muribaculaceae bacterium]|nr:hypothetical protein [Muribaculaceae bacterium]
MKQIESIHFSGDYLIPFYGARAETQFLTTYRASSYDGKSGWSINVWLVKAEHGKEAPSMAAAITREEKNYTDAAAENLNGPRASKLQHGAKLMKNLSQQLADSVYHKKPDDSFVRQLNTDLARANLRDINTDKAILLAGVSSMIER